MERFEKDISKKFVVFVFLGGLILLLIFSIAIFNSFRAKTIKYNEVTSADNNVQYYIDSQIYDKSSNILTINGWAFVKGQTIKTYKDQVMLRDNETGEFMKLPTKMVGRTDVTQKFKGSDDKLNYDKSGFVAKIRLDQLKKPLGNYEICLDYGNDNTKLFIKTGTFLMKKESN